MNFGRLGHALVQEAKTARRAERDRSIGFRVAARRPEAC